MPGLDWVLQVYDQLITDRPVSSTGVILPLATSAILNYLTFEGVTDFDEAWQFVKLIRAVDDAWISVSDSKNKPTGASLLS